MSESINNCPTAEQLKALLDGSLDAEMVDGTQSHVDGCEACQQSLEKLTAGTQSWDDMAKHLREPASSVECVNFTGEPLLNDVMQQMKDADVAEPSPRVDKLPADLLSPSDHPGAIGRIGRYEVLEVVGQGGMGIVLRAFDPTLHRVVAVKVLAPYLAHNAQARKRFIREAQAVAAVCHDHVITIHSIEDSTEQPLIVMQFVQGRSLQQKIDQSGSLTVKEILRIGMQTAAGLAAAHQQGLVHRDVKPSNILLENGIERVKLTDFGLARAVDDASLTQSGVIAGTPQYMAPEQANGDTVDHRADLFSLGSVMYAMCTGHSPFRASTTMGVLKRVCHDTPRQVRDINPDIPQWLDDIVATLLEKDPNRRFQTAKEVSEVLAAWLAHLQTPANAAPPNFISGKLVGSTKSEDEANLKKSSRGSHVSETTTFVDRQTDRSRGFNVQNLMSVVLEEIPGKAVLGLVLFGVISGYVFLKSYPHEPRLGSVVFGLAYPFSVLLIYWSYRLIVGKYGRSSASFIQTDADALDSATSVNEPLNSDPQKPPRPTIDALFATMTAIALLVFWPFVVIGLLARSAWLAWTTKAFRMQVKAKMSQVWNEVAQFVDELVDKMRENVKSHQLQAAAAMRANATMNADGAVRSEGTANPTAAMAASMTPAEANALLARQRTVTLSFVLFFIAIADFLFAGYFLINYERAMGSMPDFVAIMAGCLCLITGFHSFLLSHSLYVKENFDLVRRGCLIGMLPLSPMVILRIPVLLTTIFWLERDEVRSSFSDKPYPETVLGQVDTSLGGILSRCAPVRVFGTLAQMFAWSLFVVVFLLVPFMYFYLIPSGSAEYILNDLSAVDVRAKGNSETSLNIAVMGYGRMSGIVNRPEIPQLTGVRIDSVAADGTRSTYLISTEQGPNVTVSSSREQFKLNSDVCRQILRLNNDSNPDSAASVENLHKALHSLVHDARLAETHLSTLSPVSEDFWSQFTRRVTAYFNFVSRGPRQWTDELMSSKYTIFSRRLDPRLFSFSSRGQSSYGCRFTEFTIVGTVIGTLTIIAIGGVFILYRRHLRPVREKLAA